MLPASSRSSRSVNCSDPSRRRSRLAMPCIGVASQNQHHPQPAQGSALVVCPQSGLNAQSPHSPLPHDSCGMREGQRRRTGRFAPIWTYYAPDMDASTERQTSTATLTRLGDDAAKRGAAMDRGQRGLRDVLWNFGLVEYNSCRQRNLRDRPENLNGRSCGDE
jgi:hypothetical protein